MEIEIRKSFFFIRFVVQNTLLWTITLFRHGNTDQQLLSL